LNIIEAIETLTTIINITTVDVEERTEIITGSGYYIGDVVIASTIPELSKKRKE